MEALPTIGSYRPIRLARLDSVDRESIYGNSRLALCRSGGAPGRYYLMNERGLDVATIARFRLGYVPFSLNHVFSGRVVFPIHDAYGQLLALSVRAIIDGVEPKYWNESFIKGECLYGLWQAKYDIARMGFSILVEGQVDACSMHAHGFRNTVSLLGGMLTPLQASFLRRRTRNIVIMMDGDGPGSEHAERAKDILEYYRSRYTRFSFVVGRLPASDDPATFLQRHGSYEMKRLIVDSMSVGGMIVPRELKDDVRLQAASH